MIYIGLVHLFSSYLFFCTFMWRRNNCKSCTHCLPYHLVVGPCSALTLLISISLG